MDRFKWTPSQIEELTETQYEAIVAVINTEAQIRRKEDEKRDRESGAVKRSR